MTILGDMWALLTETPDERRIREREGRVMRRAAPQPPPKPEKPKRRTRARLIAAAITERPEDRAERQRQGIPLSVPYTKTGDAARRDPRE